MRCRKLVRSERHTKAFSAPAAQRAMAAIAINTRITTAAATGDPDVSPENGTQLEEVVKAVAHGKKETTEAATIAANKVDSAVAAVKKAVNGELENTIGNIVAKHIKPLQDSHEEMKDSLASHSKSLAELVERWAKESGEFKAPKHPRKEK